MLLGRGWKPDDRIVPGTLEHDRYGAAPPLPRKSIALADFVGGRAPSALSVLDQQSTNRCVSFAAAQVVWARLAAVGQTPRLLNIRASYVMTQRWEQNRRGLGRQPLADKGLHPVDHVEMLAEWGASSVSGPSDPELDEARVDEDVDLWTYEADADHKITGWRRIDDFASEAEILETAKRYIVAGFPGMCGTDLDPPFETYASGVYDRDPNLPSKGGHMTGLFGFDDDLGAFLAVNQWSLTWGVLGWFWMSYRTYASSFVADRYHLDAARIQ